MAVNRNGNSDCVKVLLDANALMLPVQFRVDLLAELTELLGTYELLVPSRVIQELVGLSLSLGRSGAAARYALTLSQVCTRVETTGSGSVDEDLIEYATRTKCHVLTNDREVRLRLLDRGVQVISLRNQKRLEIIRR